MTKALVLTAALALGVSGASACEFNRSAKSLDKTTVASIVKSEPAGPSMSTSEAPVPVDTQDNPADQEG